MAVVQREGGSTCADYEEGLILQTNPKTCEGSAPCYHTTKMGKLSLRRQQTLKFFTSTDLACRLRKAGTGDDPGPIPVGRRWSNRESGL